MISAGTLSRRLRSPSAIFNELRWDSEHLRVSLRDLDVYPTTVMMIGDLPEDATPQRRPDKQVAPVEKVPAVDPPLH
ncbi:hypothetical protein [Thiorhodovibrio winogradskyi]|uniref:hypothetical protein n=1 Tax=Thiorhodovibrio winogradskyi TaxID=77007 RepID=UPI002E28E0AD|nr:hypothetical protein [Thiorhodovibrio winogradskyi]